jgi:hypothetical protein
MKRSQGTPTAGWRGKPWWLLVATALSFSLIVTAIVMSAARVEYAQKIWDVAILVTAALLVARAAFRRRSDRSGDDRQSFVLQI